MIGVIRINGRFQDIFLLLKDRHYHMRLCVSYPTFFNYLELNCYQMKVNLTLTMIGAPGFWDLIRNGYIICLAPSTRSTRPITDLIPTSILVRNSLLSRAGSWPAGGPTLLVPQLVESNCPVQSKVLSMSNHLQFMLLWSTVCLPTSFCFKRPFGFSLC